MPTLTKTLVESLKPSKLITWDDAITGFGVKVHPTGKRVYVLKYGSGRRGGSRWVTIGEHEGPWAPDPVTGKPQKLTVQRARLEAEKLRGIIASGGDPAAERTLRRRMPTLAEFSERYEKEHAQPHKAPVTLKGELWMLQNKILPSLGAIRIDRIDRGDVARWHVGMKAQPNTANAALSLLSAMFTKAVEWGVVRVHPCRGIRWFETPGRERLFSPAEVAKIGAVLEDPKAPLDKSTRAAIYLLMFTGARRTEICTLRWEQIDAAEEVVFGTPAGPVRGKVVRQKSKTTGKFGKRPIIFPAAALAVLERLDTRAVGPWVIPGKHGHGHINPQSLSCAFKRAMRLAEIEDAHLHDLRHLFVTTAVRRSGSLVDAAKMAGQATLGITEKYFHIAPGELLALAGQTAATIQEMAKDGAEEPID